MHTRSNFCRISFHITEIIASFANFCDFQVMYVSDAFDEFFKINTREKNFCLMCENKCSRKASFLDLKVALYNSLFK